MGFMFSLPYQKTVPEKVSLRETRFEMKVNTRVSGENLLRNYFKKIPQDKKFRRAFSLNFCVVHNRKIVRFMKTEDIQIRKTRTQRIHRQFQYKKTEEILQKKEREPDDEILHWFTLLSC